MSVKLPDFTELGGLNTQEPSGAVGRYEGAAEAPGMAMAQTGEAIQKGSDQIQGLLDRTNTMNAVNNFQQKAAEIGNDFYSKVGAAKATAYPDYIQNLRNAADQIQGTLVTNTARQAFQSETQSHIGNEMYRAGAAAGEGVRQYNQQVFQSHQDLNLTKFNQQVLGGDAAGAADTLTAAHTAMMFHLTHDLGVDVTTDDGKAVLQDNINTLDAAFSKASVEAINSLPVTDPRRAAAVGVQPGQPVPTNNNTTAPSQQNFTPQQVSAAILGHESGSNPNAPTSAKGAVGEAQIMPATFEMYAKPGESIVNNADNLAVHNRIINDYMQRYNGDAARVAVAYISGPGNVAPAGSATPWIKDLNDGNENVSDYVAYVQKRLGAAPTASAGGAEADLTAVPAIHGIPIAREDHQKMLAAYRTDLTAAYTLQKEQQQQQDTQVMNQLEPKIADHSITYHDIESSNASGEMKNKLHELMDKPVRTDPAVFNDLVRRANLPDGSADKLTDPKELTGYLGKGITIEDRNVLEKMMGDPDELKTFFKQGHDQLSKSTMMNIDGEGERRAYNWEMATRNQIKAGQEKGLSVHQMIDPTSKDYIGGNIGQFQETLEQQASNLAGQTRAAAAPAPLPTDKQRQPGESMATWVARGGAL